MVKKTNKIRFGIRQLFNWNDQQAQWEPKSSDELSEKVGKSNALPSDMTPSKYYAQFNGTDKEVSTDDPSLTAFARAWMAAKYLDDLQKKFWWMSKKDITGLQREYASQLSDAGVVYVWPNRRSKPKLKANQIADFLLFVDADAPTDELKQIMAAKIAAKSADSE